MNSVYFFKDIFVSIPEYRKIVLLTFLIKNDVTLFYESGFLKCDIHYL